MDLGGYGMGDDVSAKNYGLIAGQDDGTDRDSIALVIYLNGHVAVIERLVIYDYDLSPWTQIQVRHLLSLLWLGLILQVKDLVWGFHSQECWY